MAQYEKWNEHCKDCGGFETSQGECPKCEGLGTLIPGKGEKPRANIPLNFFSDNIKRESDGQIKKGLRNLRKRILEHYNKIEHPEQFPEWKDIPPYIQQSIIESWKREILKLEGNVKKSEAELEERNNRDKH